MNQLDCVEPTVAQRDALDFGQSQKRSTWQDGLRVARSCRAGTGQGKRSTSTTSGQGDGKLSLREFAKISGVSETQVKLFYKAWVYAATDDGSLPVVLAHPDKLTPGQDEPNIDDLADTAEERQKLWSKYYSRAKVSGESLDKIKVELTQLSTNGSEKVKALAVKALSVADNEVEFVFQHKEVAKAVLAENRKAKKEAEKAKSEAKTQKKQGLTDEDRKDLELGIIAAGGTGLATAPEEPGPTADMVVTQEAMYDDELAQYIVSGTELLSSAITEFKKALDMSRPIRDSQSIQKIREAKKSIDILFQLGDQVIEAPTTERVE